jgi:sortase A
MREHVARLLLPLLSLLAAHQLGAGALIHAKAWLAPVLIDAAFRESVASGRTAVKPWPWADTWPVARLRVPALGIERLVLSGDSGSTLAFGPGHSRASAVPGSAGEVVIGGHRDTHFGFLRQLAVGHEILLALPDGRERRYRVGQREVVDSRAQKLIRAAAHDRLLLVTCYPFDALDSTGPLRFVVIAYPIDAPPRAAAQGHWQL